MRGLWLIPILFLGACFERAPGPHDWEGEKVTYWEVVSSRGESTGCTDSSDWSDMVSSQLFEDGSFLMYRVSEVGDTAMGQSCETLASETCTDTGRVWLVDGHILTHTPDAVLLDTASECDVEVRAKWIVLDEGETGFFQVEIDYVYATDNEACQTIEDAIKASSANGFGLADCVITLDADLRFATAN